jgi:flagellar protein FliO/FliZ
MLIFLAFLIILLLTGSAIWAARHFNKGPPPRDNERSRRLRLAVIDAASVDGRRRLILIRRDNVEHLLIIGGPTDVVIEPDIVRAAAAARGDAGMWPLRPPEPAPVARAQRAPTPEEPAQWPVLPPRRPSSRVDPFAGLAAEMMRLPEPPRIPTPPDLGRPDGFVPREPARLDQPAHEREAVREREAPAMREPVREREVIRERAPARMRDNDLTDVSQRLKAALRRPAKPDEVRPAPPVPRAITADTESSPNPRAAAPFSSQPSTTRVEPKPAKSFYDSLDREFEELLGLPAVTDNLTSQSTTASAALPVEERAIQSPPVQSSDSVNVSGSRREPGEKE